MYLILMAFGILLIAYFLSIALFTGHGNNFFFIWLAAGLLLIGAGILKKKGLFFTELPIWLKRLFLIAVCIGTAVFVFVEGCILSGFAAKAPDNLDYIIVLGAQIKKDGPSKVLRMRLDKACEYLSANPDTMVIVSGGKGADEHISEAQGMYDYLVQQGVEQGRIIREDRSVNTFQNLRFSSAFLDKEKDSTGIVTNNFHVFRAVKIAEKEGFAEVYGIAAKSDPLMQFNNMLREFFGVAKDFLIGAM